MRLCLLTRKDFDRLSDGIQRRFPGKFAKFVVSVNSGTRLWGAGFA